MHTKVPYVCEVYVFFCKRNKKLEKKERKKCEDYLCENVCEVVCSKACSLDGTVKPVLSSHLKIDKTKVLMTNSSLMTAESIAECSPLEHSAILLTCIKR